MRFSGCNFVRCIFNDYTCTQCECFDRDVPSDCPDPIHPILKVPMSKLLVD